MQRSSYQNGTVARKMRKRGPDVWVYRYKDSDGVKKSEPIGTLAKYPTKAAAVKQAMKMRDEINERVAGVTVSALCDRYIKEAIPDRVQTASTYKSLIRRIRGDWGKMRVDVMARDILAIELWIDDLQTIPTPDRIGRDGKPVKGRPARPVSRKTKIHFKAFIHRLFEHAIKWGNLPMQRNAIGLVEIKGRAKRVRIQNLITRDQWHKLIADSELLPHVRTMIFIAMLLGLRASEILGLRWEDVDLENSTLWVRRSHVGKVVDDTKTEESEQQLPIHEDLALVLKTWREKNTDEDGGDLSVNGWLFGNMVTGRPFWRDSLQEKHLTPAGKKVGIPNLGWHDFRHTYRAMMREEKISLEEQKTLMRHSDIRTTLGYGGKTPAEVGRPANAKVVELLRKRA